MKPNKIRGLIQNITHVHINMELLPKWAMISCGQLTHITYPSQRNQGFSQIWGAWAHMGLCSHDSRHAHAHTLPYVHSLWGLPHFDIHDSSDLHSLLDWISRKGTMWNHALNLEAIKSRDRTIRWSCFIPKHNPQWGLSLHPVPNNWHAFKWVPWAGCIWAICGLLVD